MVGAAALAAMHNAVAVAVAVAVHVGRAVTLTTVTLTGPRCGTGLAEAYHVTVAMGWGAAMPVELAVALHVDGTTRWTGEAEAYQVATLAVGWWGGEGRWAAGSGAAAAAAVADSRQQNAPGSKGYLSVKRNTCMARTTLRG